MEFLFEKGSSLDTQKVRGITLKYGSNLESTSSARLDGFSVENSLRQYGKPNLVLWGTFSYVRFIAWTNRGLGIRLEISPEPNDYLIDHIQNIKEISIFIFKPMNKNAFLSNYWPGWGFPPPWSTKNNHEPGTSDQPDYSPKDPFNWPKIMESIK
ncbi:MAG TPA: hypothetical protein PKW33_18055 [Anaerolineaceae bacterium]|nr:hypothetical protein [Anaerolineaceae bacterium]HPN53504.1 hypothetical protein [Anaerolineaceae bacterium]